MSNVASKDSKAFSNFVHHSMIPCIQMHAMLEDCLHSIDCMTAELADMPQ